MQEAQHALQVGSQAIEAIVQRLQSLEGAAKQAQQSLIDARAAIGTTERAQSEAQFHERSCHEKVESHGRLALSLGERLQALASNRANVSGELGKLEESVVRERLQAALHTKAERERVLSDARAGLEQVTDELRALEEGRLAVEQGLEPLRQKHHGAAREGAGSRHARRDPCAAPRGSGRHARGDGRADREARAFLAACRPRSTVSPKRSMRWGP